MRFEHLNLRHRSFLDIECGGRASRCTCRSHYSIKLLNIAVNGMNITTPASFEVTSGGGGVIMDSGTTLAYLVQNVYTEFIAQVSIRCYWCFISRFKYFGREHNLSIMLWPHLRVEFYFPCDIRIADIKQCAGGSSEVPGFKWWNVDLFFLHWQVRSLLRFPRNPKPATLRSHVAIPVEFSSDFCDGYGKWRVTFFFYPGNGGVVQHTSRFPKREPLLRRWSGHEFGT